MTKKTFFVDNPVTEVEQTEPADYETAIKATGFGKFNWLLILIFMPAVWTVVFEATSMSYLFTVAHCDLKLSLSDRGLLNAGVFIGMICSAPICGFLGDTLGRRKLLVFGLFADALFVFISAFSQTFTLLMITKFLGGFVVNAAHTVFAPYISEFHSTQFRPRIQLSLGFFRTCGNLALPLLAWATFSQDVKFTLFETLDFHSWNIYLFVCGLPAFISGTCFLFLPETPKFLMTVGRNEEALRVFQTIYSWNCGKAPETFPIKTLVDEIELNKASRGHITANRSKIEALKEGWQQILPLFLPPFVTKLVLVCVIATFKTMGLNVLRLWMPQIFTAINDYKYYHNGTTSSLCEMIHIVKPANALIDQTNETLECFVNTDNSSVYLNSMIVAMVSMSGYAIAGMIINKVGKKRILISFGIVAGICCICIYFAQDVITTIALSSIFIALTSVAGNVLTAIAVDIFPTSLRTMTIAFALMAARVGSTFGNILFPLLLEIGCEPPFFFVGSVVIFCGFLAIFLPNTENKALK